jgi:propane 2-monooxygenase large subunit
VVAETAFTNTLFVAMPSEAARNGDYALPTVFLSVQSDESRHIGNGHSLLMSLINDPDNHQLLERDLRYAFWQNHAIVDAAIGTFIEYGTTNRDKNKESYAELWHRWIYEDYYRTYMLPLEKYGIKIHHDDVGAAWDRMVKKNYVHKTAQFFSVGWPVNFWRIDAQTDRDFEWFEHKYPGWYAEFGDYWKWYAKLSTPGEKAILFNQDVGYVYPHRCWSCMVPCLIREDFCCDEVDGQVYTYCSEICRWTHKTAFAAEYEGRPTPAMGRFSGRREWESCYDGWDVADAIKDLGFVRSDGQTLMPQPHLIFDDRKMWKLEHMRGDKLGSPLQAFRKLTPEQREAATAAYRAGYKINPA